MTAHLTISQRTFAHRLRAKDMSLRDIAKEIGCDHSGINVMLRGHLFTSMFTASRTAGWSAHILEQKRTGRLVRPSARYIGKGPRKPESVTGWDASVIQLHS